MQFDILISRKTRPRGERLLRALHAGAQKHGINTSIIHEYVYRPDTVLMLYGMGGPDRMPHACQHMARGGRIVVWDAGYWNRTASEAQRSYRVSIDGLHPQRFVMQGRSPGPARLDATSPSVKERKITGDGYILLAGNGPKSHAIGAAGWTAARSAQIRQAFPDKKIYYRPKPKRPAEPSVNFDELSKGSIADALVRCSLVVCRHSNVAVDACFLGVPVVCDDGAAASIYPNQLGDAHLQPSCETRNDFLQRLAWWQWSQEECAHGLVWPWLIERLHADQH